MAKKPSDSPGTSLATNLHMRDQMPEHLRNADERDIMSTLMRHIVPPRLKVVHKMAKPPIKGKFRESDVIMMPTMQMIAPSIWLEGSAEPEKQGTPFTVIPLYMYAEYMCWNPLETRGKLPAVRDRSTDPTSRLAAKCQDKRFWFEKFDDLGKGPKGEDLMARNIEHLQFVVALHGPEIGDFADIPVLISYAKIHHKVGSNFAQMIRLRGSMCGSQFVMRATYGENDKGSWHSLVPENPSEESGITPFVMETDRHAMYQALQNDLKAAHKSGLLRAEMDDDDVVDDTPKATTEY